jgi:hypothetical protein
MSYLRCAIQGTVPAEGGTAARAAGDDSTGIIRSRLAAVLYRAEQVYERMQRRFVGRHAAVEAALAVRAVDGRVSPGDRARYRSSFYWPVRGWNALGDNVRRYAIGVLVLTNHLEWFFVFVLLPMNVLLVALSLWQWRADTRFLSSL